MRRLGRKTSKGFMGDVPGAIIMEATHGVELTNHNTGERYRVEHRRTIVSCGPFKGVQEQLVHDYGTRRDIVA